jgi:hypothetical protein
MKGDTGDNLASFLLEVYSDYITMLNRRDVARVKDLQNCAVKSILNAPQAGFE